MNTLNIHAMALALSLAFSAGAMADSLSRVDYKAGKHQIEGQYKAGNAACNSFSGNAKDICVAAAKDHCLAQARKSFGKP